MNIINSISDFEELLTIPFTPKAILYSLKSDFFKNGNALCKTGAQQFAVDLDEDVQPFNNLPQFPCGEKGCKVVFSNVHDYEVHFRSVHSLVCSECKRSFPTYNLLDVHIEEKHDSYHEAAKARNKASFECFVEGCRLTFASSDERDSHVVADHKFPPNFKYQNLKKSKVNESEEMDVEQQGEPSAGVKRKPVPKNFCFGRGSSRAFVKVPKRKANRDITMKELADAL